MQQSSRRGGRSIIIICFSISNTPFGCHLHRSTRPKKPYANVSPRGSRAIGTRLRSEPLLRRTDGRADRDRGSYRNVRWEEINRTAVARVIMILSLNVYDNNGRQRTRTAYMYTNARENTFSKQPHIMYTKYNVVQNVTTSCTDNAFN